MEGWVAPTTRTATASGGTQWRQRETERVPGRRGELGPFFQGWLGRIGLVFWSQVGAWRGLEIELVKLKLLKTETFSNRISTAHALMVRAALLRRSCDGAAQTSSVALILRVASRRDALNEEPASFPPVLI